MMNNQETKEKIELLMKVKGIGCKNAEYLLMIGINSPVELVKQTEQELFDKFKKLYEEKKVGYQIKEGKKWIEMAKTGNYMYAFAETKYQDLIERSFENQLRLLLYKCIKEEKLDFDVNDKIFNEIDENLKKEYKKAYENMGEVRSRNKKIKAWINDKKNSKKYDKLKDIFKKLFSKTLSWEVFRKKYGEDSSKNRCCYYCGIKETDIDQLDLDGKINTKRLYIRGRKMEVERRDPLGDYIETNIELCCYWCNNAKSDEFTEDEFGSIKEAIKEVWEKRLGRALSN